MKKYTSNKTNVWLNALLPLLAAFIVLGLTFFTLKKINEINHSLLFPHKITSQFVKLDDLKNRLLFSYKYDIESIEISESDFQQQLNSDANDFYSLLNDIQQNRIIKKDERLTGITDSLQTLYQQQADNITQLHAMLKRKGTISSGLIYELISYGISISESSGSIESSSIHKSIEDLLIAQSDFIFGADLVSSNILTTYVNTLENEFGSIEDETVRDNLIEEIHNYRNVARNLIELNDRIGLQNGSSGLLADYSKTNQLSDILNERVDFYLVQHVNQKKKLVIWFVASVSIIFIILITIFYTSRMQKLIYHPLNMILNYTDILHTGKIPEETLQINTSDEFDMIGRHLNSMVELLKEKTKFVRSLNNGDLKADFDLADDDDVLGKELLDIQINTQKSAAERVVHDEENAKRRYINEGIAKFSEITHARYDQIEKLTDAFIRELVKYLNAIQGGIFLIKEDSDGNELILVSSFAYDRKKYLTKTVKLGEGLVGTCALEKRPVFLTEIPPDYMSVTSGLGDVPPKYLLLLPMLQEDTLAGVIELASLNEFKEHETEFSTQVANNLANTLSSTRINERTSKLLAESQEHAQAMAEQEEEMRQNMEELKATQEESSRREEEFKGVADALGKTLFVAEFDLNGRLISINEKFLIFLGKDRKQVIGKTFPEMVKSEKASKVDRDFIETICNGNHEILADVIKTGKKKIYKVQFHFSPELNRDEIPYKLLCLGIETID